VKLFSPLYEKVLKWAAHRHAPWYLGMLSFAESSFFPIPPDVMLAPMSLSKPGKAWYFASLTTITSVLGGVLGYFIGYFLFDELGQPLIELYNAQEKFDIAKGWFDEYGVWVVFIAGFSPIPYKLFTVTSGVLSLALLPFLLASAIGRGARFFLVAGLIYWGGEKFAEFLKRRIDVIGWLTVALIVAVLVVWSVLN
jgi:membrane protein YqaA with SNARE-associated domain